MHEFVDMVETMSSWQTDINLDNKDPLQIYIQMKQNMLNVDYLDRRKKTSKLIFYMNVIKVVCYQIQQLSGNISDDIFQNYK